MRRANFDGLLTRRLLVAPLFLPTSRLLVTLCWLTTLCPVFAIATGCSERSQSDQSSYSPQIDKQGVMTAPELGIAGAWYGIGDAFGEFDRCVTLGKHKRESCSSLFFPRMDGEHGSNPNFPNEDGRMCAWGEVAKVLNCCSAAELEDPDSQAQCEPPPSCHPSDPGCADSINLFNCAEGIGLDYESMWGAGIGFNFLAEASDIKESRSEQDRRGTFSAIENKIRGLSFQLEWLEPKDPIPLRVSLHYRVYDDVRLPEGSPTIRFDGEWIDGGEVLKAPSASEEYPDSPYYWYRPAEYTGAEWPDSPVRRGDNELLFSEVYPPPNSSNKGDPLPIPEIFLDSLLGVSFQVIPDGSGTRARPFSFCISDLKFLRTP